MYADPSLDHYLDFLRFVPATLCFILNAMLVWMIFMNRNKDLGAYRYFLLTLVLADMVNALIHVVIMPIPELYKNAFILGAHSWWNTGAAVCFSTVAFSLPYCVLSFNFLYRLVAVKYPFSLACFKMPSIISFLTFLAVTNCIMWCAIDSYCGIARSENKRYAVDLFTGVDPFPTYLRYDVDDIDNYSIFVYWDRGIFDGLHWVDIVGSVIMAISIASSYSFMTYATYASVKHLREVNNLSNRNYHQHVQLLRSLLLQALAPFITSYMPIACCCLLPIFGITHPLFSVITPIFCAFHPVFDEIIMISTVSQFRNTVMDRIYCRPERKNSKVISIEHVRVMADTNGGRKNTY